MTIKIEKGIPMPQVKNPMAAYPFPEMEVGDSCLVLPKEGEVHLQVRERVSAGVTHAQRKGDRKFCTRSVEGGIRVWRIS